MLTRLNILLANDEVVIDIAKKHNTPQLLAETPGSAIIQLAVWFTVVIWSVTKA